MEDDFYGENYEDDLDDDFNPEDELNENFHDLVISDVKEISRNNKGGKITVSNDKGKNNLTVSVTTSAPTFTMPKEENNDSQSTSNEKNEVKTENTDEKPKKKKTGLASLFD